MFVMPTSSVSCRSSTLSELVFSRRSRKSAQLDFPRPPVLIIVKLVLKAEITPKPAPPQLRSLGEVHSSVGTSHVSIWRRLFALAVPAYLVSVGYMDPGNWATD